MSSYENPFGPEPHQDFDAMTQQILEDVRLVGENKPLGSLGIDMLTERGVDVPGLIEEAQEHGNQVFITNRYLPDDEVEQELYVYHPQTMHDFLNSRADVLAAYGWPSDIEGFLDAVTNAVVLPYNELNDIVADAYANYSHPLRSDATRLDDSDLVA